ncbi:hypothetical protein [Kangiella sp.]|uniref:hypothetical protein n=1 Tax=Kangiella sp. TaxID=1920245 RepID=UPI0019B6302E|nr:hypothetical protein [Kangiella sp.]MBD3652895.1 hypothetical protein [Kangiella sp.]
MKKVLILSLAALGLSACSTASTNNFVSEQAGADSPEQQICFYTKKQGWNIKEKTCMSKQKYQTSRVSFMPNSSQSQSSRPISVDDLPHSSK